MIVWLNIILGFSWGMFFGVLLGMPLGWALKIYWENKSKGAKQA